MADYKFRDGTRDLYWIDVRNILDRWIGEDGGAERLPGALDQGRFAAAVMLADAVFAGERTTIPPRAPWAPTEDGDVVNAQVVESAIRSVCDEDGDYPGDVRKFAAMLAERLNDTGLRHPAPGTVVDAETGDGEPLSHDPEVQVIATVADALETVAPATRTRIIRWAAAKYDAEVPF